MAKKTNTKSTKATKTTKAAPAPATTPAPATENVVQNTVEPVSTLDSINSRFATMLQELDSQRKAISETIKQVRESHKQIVREVKVLEKRANKRRPRKDGERKPSGFAKETNISNDLAKFLGKPTGTMMSRTQVTKEINAYIKQHKLQDPNQGKIINPDKRLKTLLRVPTGQELTYFNLQTYMKHLFPKPAATQ
jgi:chromatin remodeling complex protein RSC6